MSYLKCFLRDRRGSAAAEFALVTPILSLLTLFMGNFGYLLIIEMKLSTAISAGSQWAISDYTQNVQTMNANVSSGSYTNFQTSLQSLVSTVSGIDPTVTVIYNNGNTANTACWCPSGSSPSVAAGALVSPADPWNYGGLVPCGTACSTSNVTAGKYLSIVATYLYKPILPTPITPQKTLTEYALVRLQ